MGLKIAYCLPSLYIAGGMERVLTTKANYFADILGHDIYIILTDGKDRPPFYKLSPKVKIVNLDVNFNELWTISSFFKKIPFHLKKQRIYKRRLREALFEIRPDITISMLRREIDFINSIKDGSIKIGETHVVKENLRYVGVGEKESFINRAATKIWNNLLIGKLRKLSAFVILTNEDREKWTNLKNTTVIHNPLESFPTASSDCENKKVIAVGRYVYIKGFDMLIEAWKIVAEKHPDWELHIYGNGDKEPLEKQIETLGLKSNCFLDDPVKNIEEKFLESSIHVLSSRCEGFGLVLAEAMSCGVPPVSFDCPCGPKEIIKHGENGLLVESFDIEKLSENICYLIENESVRKEMGKRAKENAERFRIEKIAGEWERLFRELIDKRG